MPSIYIAVALDSLLYYALMYVPSFIFLFITGFSIQKHERFTKDITSFGKKIGEIRNKKNIRLWLVTPLYLFFFGCSVFGLFLFKKYVIANAAAMLFTTVIIGFFEYAIFQKDKLKGVYEKGIVYPKGSYIYEEIPEIKIKANRLEILNQDGMTETIQTDETAINLLQKILNFENGKIVNTDWQKNISHNGKIYKNCSGRIFKS